MLPSDQLATDLREALSQLARQPLVEVLLQHGILRQLAADHLRRRLCDSVHFSSDEVPLVIGRLFQGVAVEPPTALAPGWIEALPPMLQGPLRDRWDQIRLQKWMEERYRDRLDAYFLERREDLEQVVYGMIRLRHQGVAEELYLRLLDDEADFGDLAKQYSLGEERFTRGLVGPMRISQPHPTIRAVLQKLAIGDLHPPFMVDNWILLVRMEHRQPAQLTDTTMLLLCQELLQQDLDATLDDRLQALYPSLLQAYPALTRGGSSAEAALREPVPQPLSPQAAEPDVSAPAMPQAGPEPKPQANHELSVQPASAAAPLPVPQAPATEPEPAASPQPAATVQAAAGPDAMTSPTPPPPDQAPREVVVAAGAPAPPPPPAAKPAGSAPEHRAAAASPTPQSAAATPAAPRPAATDAVAAEPGERAMAPQQPEPSLTQATGAGSAPEPSLTGTPAALATPARPLETPLTEVAEAVLPAAGPPVSAPAQGVAAALAASGLQASRSRRRAATPASSPFPGLFVPLVSESQPGYHAPYRQARPDGAPLSEPTAPFASPQPAQSSGAPRQDSGQDPAEA